MTKPKEPIPAKADQGHVAKGAPKPARVAKAAIAQPKTGRGVDLAKGVAPVMHTDAILALKAAPAPKPPRRTKAALLRARLAEPGGVSMAALMAVTGWQAHTLRAALSGLRKEGLTLTRRREVDDTIYAIAAGGTVMAGPTSEDAAQPVDLDGATSASRDDDVIASCDAAPASAASKGATE